MPKSKRAKVVHTSRVEKKGKEGSEKLYNGIQEAADQHKAIYVFKVDNMRNKYLKEVRAEFSDSRIFFGKTKVMAKAITSLDHLPNLSTLTTHMSGDIGLLFTSRTTSEIQDFLSSYSASDFARAGTPAPYTFTVPAGIVYSTGGITPESEDAPMPHSVETTLRKWGMPTRLEKGKIMLDGEYTVCTEGKMLDSNQAALLKRFGVEMAEFRVRLVAGWREGTGEVEVFEEADPDAMED